MLMLQYISKKVDDLLCCWM